MTLLRHFITSRGIYALHETLEPFQNESSFLRAELSLVGFKLGKHNSVGSCTHGGVSLLGSSTLQHMDQLHWTKANQLSFNKKIYKGLQIPAISLKFTKNLKLTFKVLENLQQNFILMINSWKCDILVTDNFMCSIYPDSHCAFIY